jgi:hypothetical protein
MSGPSGPRIRGVCMDVATVCKNIITTVFHLLSRLWRSPVLLLWLILGIVVAFIAEGMQGIISSLVNLCLIGVYAVIIKMMTEGKTPQK